MTDTASSSQTDWTRWRTIQLQTRRRDGRWVATPVSLVVVDGHGYFRTYDQAGKVKRMRNFADVLVAPSSLAGTPRAAPVAATTRRLDGAEAELARNGLARRYPLLHRWMVPWLHRRKGWTTVHYELIRADIR
ncbi:PPOX class F420-dependent oxidoreductase [Herbiconiux daphne]|uniref:PPOX class F420-dependent oxidoreductase n=1 Tax=Herbiconiux daphne TaxID=2970914 RepID=A0ABT2GXQ1_9MICO|nr:PPOX class F420-dependent oxidoreductase [Herbiconiux daphne]MCS5732740.1 PPOX class F420-dependent oxidoreductase [Herbiconiux daphne]